MPETKKCAYCGKERPIKEMSQGTITTRGTKWSSCKGKYVASVERTINWYCADGGCQDNDQMTQEG